MPTTEGRVQNGRFVFSCPRCNVSMSLAAGPATGATWVDCDDCLLRFDVVTTGYLAKTALGRFVVSPHESRLPPPHGDAPAVVVATIVLLVSAAVVAAVYFVFRSSGQPTLAISLCAAVALMAVVAFLVRNSRGAARVQRQRDAWAKRQQADDEASNLTAHLHSQLEQIHRYANDVGVHHERAREAIELARREFSARAYSSFWDALATAKSELLACVSGVEGLSSRIRSYVGHLRARLHTFPLPPIAPTDLPSTDILCRELSSIARQGETDFQFATILEHKKTREVLVAGFASVAGAIDNLAATLDAGLEALREQLAEGQQHQAASDARLHTTLADIRTNTAQSANTDKRVSDVIDKYNLLDD
jgi:hypothetical protein